MLRYRTGDLVRPIRFDAEPCACGRHDMGLEGGSSGRTDEMVIVRGVNIYPSAVEEIVRGFAEVAEYEVRVDKSASLTELILRIEPHSGCADAGSIAPACAKRVARRVSIAGACRTCAARQPASLRNEGQTLEVRV